jgi:rifampin ADP-ribosylating transferase
MSTDHSSLSPKYPSPPPYYHGTRIDLKVGDLLGPGYATNYGTGKKANYIYFAATLEASIWGAELAQGEGRQRIYIVEPTGPWTDDPNLTDKKFPGNPTKSYRSKEPLRIIGEVAQWTGHTPEQLEMMHGHLARLKQQGIAAVDD